MNKIYLLTIWSFEIWYVLNRNTEFQVSKFHYFAVISPMINGVAFQLNKSPPPPNFKQTLNFLALSIFKVLAYKLNLP